MSRNQSVATWLRNLAAISDKTAKSDTRQDSYHRGTALLYRGRAAEIEAMPPMTGVQIADWLDSRADHREIVGREDSENPESFHRTVAILYRTRAADIRAEMDIADGA